MIRWLSAAPAVLVLVLCLLVQTGEGGVSESKPFVLAGHDITLALSKALLDGTGVNAERAVPKGYSTAGQASYMKKHREEFFKLARSGDAVVCMTSARPDDPLYPHARRANIRIVQIDSTRPLDGFGAGVPLLEISGEGVSTHVWRSPARLSSMAAITASDFCALYPQYAEIIRENLRKITLRLLKIRSRYEILFGDIDNTRTAALTTGFAYLTDEFGLDSAGYRLKPESRWTAGDCAEFRQALRDNGVAAVVCAGKPGPVIADAIQEAGVGIAVLRRYQYTEGADPLESTAAWFEANLAALAEALAPQADRTGE